MVRVYLISGDGAGAGKTTLAETLVGPVNVWSLAGAMRHELQKIYPGYDWFNKTQAYKNDTVVKEHKDRLTVRDVLREYGQERSLHCPTYWVERLVDRLVRGASIASGAQIGIDDLRKVAELDYCRMKLKNCIHIHVVNPDAVKEPIFDNDLLRDRADYRMVWK